MTGQDLIIGLTKEDHHLRALVETLRKEGKLKAQYEREHRVARALKTLELKEQGLPATLIGDVVRGDIGVVELCYLRDVATTNYEATKEAINVSKLNLRSLLAQYQEEYAVERRN